MRAPPPRPSLMLAHLLFLVSGCRPFATLHSFTVLSLLPDASSVPSGEKATPCT